MNAASPWAPATLLVLGAALTFGSGVQRALELRQPLGSVVPASILGLQGTDITIAPEERKIAGMTDYLFRVYQAQPPQAATGVAANFSIYIGYYDQQAQGHSIHSPKNCLPGAGWEPLQSRERAIQTSAGRVPVNEYLLQNGSTQAIVLYWYQGRGRVVANEYAVKLDMLKDAALRHRTDEALVRIVMPILPGENRNVAAERAYAVARILVPALYQVLPG